jgi:hypothetical protein
MDTVSVNVDGYGEVAVPAGTSAELVLEQANIEAASRPKKNAFPPLAVLINNELAPLSSPIGAPCSIKPVYPDSPMGTEVYRRSLCFILALAAREIVPSRRLTVSMAIGNGYYHYSTTMSLYQRSFLKRFQGA